MLAVKVDNGESSQFETRAIMMEFMMAQQVLGKTISYCLFKHAKMN